MPSRRRPGIAEVLASPVDAARPSARRGEPAVAPTPAAETHANNTGEGPA